MKLLLMDKNTYNKDQISQTIDTYNAYASVYDWEVIDFWDKFPMGSIHAFVQNLPDKNILNLGSGTGRDAVLLRDAGCDVHCVDGSEIMVQITRSLGFKSDIVNFDSLEIKPKTYSGVWAYTSLLHIHTQKMLEVVKKIHLALPAQGIFMIGMIQGDFEGMVKRESMPGAERYFKHYKDEELNDLISTQGFTRIYQDTYTPSSKVYLNHVYKKY